MPNLLGRPQGLDFRPFGGLGLGRGDFPENDLGIHHAPGGGEAARERGFRGEGGLLVEQPHFFAELGAAQFRGEAAEKAGQIGDIPKQEALGVGVPGGVRGLGEVDDHRAVGGVEDVVLGQVAVDDPGA